MYAGLVTASIIVDLLNSTHFTVPVEVVVNDRDGNLATVFFDTSIQRWKWKQGADQQMLEAWAQQSLYRNQLNQHENGENDDQD